MKQAEILADKWSRPGWRIEPRYSSKVLLGNWMEERLTFAREATTADTTSRVDYHPHGDFRPDFSERSSALSRAEGLSSKLLFAHPGPPSSNYLVTHYEESYGQNHFSSLPVLKPDRHRLALPAHLGSQQRTKTGLEEQQSHLPSLTVYRSAYQRHPLSALCQRRAARASRATSSHLLAANHYDKDLNTRQRALRRVPDVTF
ncbi:cilia- and flagella-associated protein 107 [Neosynchiropus ocellatus]